MWIAGTCAVGHDDRKLIKRAISMSQFARLMVFSPKKLALLSLCLFGIISVASTLINYFSAKLIVVGFPAWAALFSVAGGRFIPLPNAGFDGVIIESCGLEE